MGSYIALGIFIVLSIILYSGKGSLLIAGFNTLPKEDRKKYDAAALSKFMGKVFFVYSFCIVLSIYAQEVGNQWFYIIGLILFIGVTVFMLINVNTGNRFKK